LFNFLNTNILQQICFCKAIKINFFVSDLTPGPSPKERGAGTRHSAFGASHPSPLERGRG
jgi:hypothetical protein